MSETTDVITLKELVEGTISLVSRGISKLKVTEDGKVRTVELPIKSMSMDDFLGELGRRAPLPPVKREFVRAGSEEGQRLGLTKDHWVDVLDHADPAFNENIKEFNLDALWWIAIKGLDTKFRDKEGNEVTDYEGKKRILGASGITVEQLHQLVSDIRHLTEWGERRADFLSGEPLGLATPFGGGSSGA